MFVYAHIKTRQDYVGSTILCCFAAYIINFTIYMYDYLLAKASYSLEVKNYVNDLQS